MNHSSLLSDLTPNLKFGVNRHDLLVEKLMETYFWEMKILEMLPIMQTASQSSFLQKKIAIYHAKKGEQVELLQQFFILIDQPIAGKKSTLAELLLSECEKLTSYSDLQHDKKILEMLFTISHFNQIGYNFLISLAPVLNFEEINNCIKESLFIETDLMIKLKEFIID